MNVRYSWSWWYSSGSLEAAGSRPKEKNIRPAHNAQLGSCYNISDLTSNMWYRHSVVYLISNFWSLISGEVDNLTLAVWQSKWEIWQTLKRSDNAQPRFLIECRQSLSEWKSETQTQVSDSVWKLFRDCLTLWQSLKSLHSAELRLITIRLLIWDWDWFDMTDRFVAVLLCKNLNISNQKHNVLILLSPFVFSVIQP